MYAYHKVYVQILLKLLRIFLSSNKFHSHWRNGEQENPHLPALCLTLGLASKDLAASLVGCALFGCRKLTDLWLGNGTGLAAALCCTEPTQIFTYYTVDTLVNSSTTVRHRGCIYAKTRDVRIPTF